MRQKNNIIINEELHDRIVNAAYSDASIKERMSIYFLRKKYADVNNLFNEYRETYLEVKKAAGYKFSQSQENELYKKLDLNSNNSNSFLYDLYTLFISKPVFSIAVSSAIILITAYSLIFRERFKPDTNHSYTQEEIFKAKHQAKESLGLVFKALNETKEIINEDIIPQKLLTPIKNGMNKINQYIN